VACYAKGGNSLRTGLTVLPARAMAWLGFGGGKTAEPETLRARERHWRIVMTAGTSALAKAASVATILISVPLTLHYLGGERYGVWATISSFSLMLAFADLGIGNGLLTAVARGSGANDVAKIRGYISSAAFVLSAIGVAIALAGLVLAPFFDWTRLFNVYGGVAQREVRPAMQVFLVCFGMSLPATLVQRVQMGLQRGFVSNLWQCAASFLTMGSVVVAAWVSAPLPWLVAAFLVPPLAIGLLNSLVFFRYLMPSVAPAMHCISRPLIAEVMRTGGMFFVLQIALAAAFFSDSLLISRALGAASVTEYSIADRLFSLVSQLISLAVLPLWPALGEALARNDWPWAWRTLVIGTIGAFAASLLISLLLLLGSPFIIHHWVGDGFNVPFALLLGFAVWRVVEATAGAPSMYLNALQAVRFQVVCAILMATCALILKLVLIRPLGIAALPWITVCSYVIFSGLPTFVFLRRHRRAQFRMDLEGVR